MSGTSFYPRELDCTHFECNLSKDGRNCTINHENDYSRLIKDIWVCSNKYSSGLITAKASCYDNKVYPDNYCYLSYNSNGPLISDPMPRLYLDSPTNPSPPTDIYKPEFVTFILFIFWLFIAVAALVTMDINISSTNSESQTNNQHSHLFVDNSIENAQQFCDNPDHFTFDNESPPAYDAIKRNYKESTPLLSATRLKRCIKPSCANYLKPFKLNKEYNKERHQAAASASPSCSNTDFLIHFPSEDSSHHDHHHRHHGNKSDHCHHDKDSDHKPHNGHCNRDNDHRFNDNNHSYHSYRNISHDNSSHSFNHQNNHSSESAQIIHNSNNDHHTSYENHGANTDHHTSFDHHDSAFDSHHD